MPMSPTGRKSIVIIGGGASGVLLAAHLLRDRKARVQVTLIEKRRELGRGVAYSTCADDHVLNVVAGNMSAFPDDPDHFWRWLRARDLVAEGDRFLFVPRRHYGDYLGTVLADAADPRLVVLTATATDVVDGAVQLDNGINLAADAIVLATGHDEAARPGTVRPGSPADTPLPPDAPVLILGTGLSAVDAWLTLSDGGHRGPIALVSRHGRLPLRHRAVERAVIDNVPLGASARDLMRWLRATVRAHGGDWRGMVDGLRPWNQRIWQAWPDHERKRFLRHIRPFWAVHRHRLPPAIHDRLIAAIASGQLSVYSALRGAPDPAAYARIYDCTGLLQHVERSSNPLLRALAARGDIRPDPQHIGIDVTARCETIARDGGISGSLFALGPLTRGAFFEIEAIPDIRVQAAALAAHLQRPGLQIPASLLRERAGIGGTSWANSPARSRL